jgi:hypothetical protein
MAIERAIDEVLPFRNEDARLQLKKDGRVTPLRDNLFHVKPFCYAQKPFSQKILIRAAVRFK